MRPAFPSRLIPVADSKLGTKRIDPETGRKFYDLGRDPIVSPYTGVAYPRSYFEANTVAVAREEEEEPEEREAEVEEGTADTVTLEEADEEAKGGDDLPDLGDDEVDLGEDDSDDTFLEEEEEEEEGVSGILNHSDVEEG
jgi:uncharacterized protein (TIGR02300 family)